MRSEIWLLIAFVAMVAWFVTHTPEPAVEPIQYPLPQMEPTPWQYNMNDPRTDYTVAMWGET